MSACFSPFKPLHFWLYFKGKYSISFHLSLLILRLTRIFCSCDGSILAILFMLGNILQFLCHNSSTGCVRHMWALA